MLDPDTQAPNKTRIAAIDHVDVVDEYTVNVVTQYPAPTLLQGMAEDGFCAMMVPVQHTSTSLETLGSEPVGTGPYMLKEWVKDDHITLVANDAYWGTAPAIKTIIFRPIPETSTAISELKSGGVDVITNVPPEQMDGLNTDTTKVVAKATDRLFYINVNTLEEGPLQNKLVRQAIAYAIDVDAINESLHGGMAQRTAINLPLEAFGYDASLTPYEYNPEKAKELLALLVDRRGGFVTSADIITALWEDEPITAQTRTRCRKVALRLNRTLEANGAGHIIESVRGKRRIVPEAVACDLFDFLSPVPNRKAAFRGSYLKNYSWAEATLAELMQNYYRS